MNYELQAGPNFIMMDHSLATRYVFQFLSNRRVQVTWILAIGLLANGFTLLIPILLAQVLEKAYAGQSLSSGWSNGFEDWSAFSIQAMVFMMFVLMVGKMILDRIFRLQSAQLGEQHTKVLREQLFEHQLLMNFDHYLEKGGGRFLLRYSGDLSSIRNFLSLGVLRFGSDLILLLLMLLVLGLLSPFLSFIFLMAILVFFSGVLILNRFLNRVAQVHRNQKSGMLSFVQKRFELLSTIKAFNRVRKEHSHFVKRSSRVYEAGMAYHRWNALIRALIPFLTYSLILFVLLFSFSEVGLGQAGTWNQVSVSTLLVLTIQPVLRRIFLVGSTWEKGKISYAKLDRVFQYEREPYKMGDFELPTWPIRISGSLPKHQEKIKIELAAQEWIYLGKSVPFDRHTLSFSLLGLIRHPDFKIRFGDHDIQEMDRFILRKHIAGLSSALALSGDTVFTAVSYNRKAKNRKKAQDLLDAFQEEISTKERLNLNQKIGYKGAHLSASQKKLLQWIRLFMTQKAVWIIEEPFNHLPEGQIKRIQNKLDNMMPRPTILWMSDPQPVQNIQKPLMGIVQKKRSV